MYSILKECKIDNISPKHRIDINTMLYQFVGWTIAIIDYNYIHEYYFH